MPKTLEDIAREARAHFTSSIRASGTHYVHTRADVPDWVMEMCGAAHSGMFPDDCRYEYIVDALDILANGDDENAIESDVYTSDLTAWLASDDARLGYCDQYRDEYGADGDAGALFTVLSGGQWLERREVFDLVRQALEEELERREDAAEDGA